MSASTEPWSCVDQNMQQPRIDRNCVASPRPPRYVGARSGRSTSSQLDFHRGSQSEGGALALQLSQSAHSACLLFIALQAQRSALAPDMGAPPTDTIAGLPDKPAWFWTCPCPQRRPNLHWKRAAVWAGVQDWKRGSMACTVYITQSSRHADHRSRCL